MIPWFPKLLQMIAMIDYPKWLPSSPECAKNFCLLKCILFFLLLAFIQELSDLKAHQRRETMIKGIAPSPINNPTRKLKTKLQIVLSGYKIRNPIHSPNHIQTHHLTIRLFCVIGKLYVFFALRFIHIWIWWKVCLLQDNLMNAWLPIP